MPTLTVVLAKRLAPVLSLLFLVTLLTPGQASAQVSGRISVGTLTFTLTDLDASDGISPSLVFLPLPYVPPVDQSYEGATIYSRFHEFPGAGQEFAEVYGTGTDTLSHEFRVSDNVWVTASISGRDRVDTHLIEIETFSSILGTKGNVMRGADAYASAGRLPFILSPNTAVTFTVQVDVNAEVTQGHLREEYFVATAAMYLYLGEDPVEIGQRELYSARPELWYGTHASLDVSDMLQVAVENNGDTYQSGNVLFYAAAGGISGLAPGIPEPAMLPMLAAGLLVGGLWRWKQSRSAA